MIWHKTPGQRLQRAAGNENEAVCYLVWLIKCAQLVLSAGQKLPPISIRDLIAAVNESPCSKPNVTAAFNQL